MSKKTTLQKKQNKKNWLTTLIAIVIWGGITLLTSWYAITSSKQDLAQAEYTRLHRAKEHLVAIIEEHIVNKDTLDLEGFNRLINNRIREDKLYKKLTVYDLLTQAEYNIQSSKHLSFDKKLEYSDAIATLYKTLDSDSLGINLSETRFPVEIEGIVSAFHPMNKDTGTLAITTLIQRYENNILNLQKIQLEDEFIVDKVLQSPTKLIVIVSAYFVFMVAFIYYIKLLNRRRNNLTVAHITDYEKENPQLEDNIIDDNEEEGERLLIRGQ